MEIFEATSELNAYSLVTYNLSGLPPSVKTKVSQYVYGKKNIKRVNGKTYRYHYKGLKHEPRVTLISESTLLLPKDQVDSFIEFLEQNNVKYKVLSIWKT